MAMYRCGVCSLVFDGDDAPDKCPKCGAAKENFSKIEGESADLIEKSRRTNEYHAAIIGLYSKIQKWAGIIKEENLDPNCVLIADSVLTEAYETIQSIKAELEAHMKKGKWG